MPFGLHSAPATFQRLMNTIIDPDMDPYCFVYLSDIIVLRKNFDDHLANLLEVFRRLYAVNLKLQSANFVENPLKYLGHLVTAEGIWTDPDKLGSVQALPAPTNVLRLRRFLGVTSRYRRLVNNFAKIAFPLNQLCKKKFVWTYNAEQEIEELSNFRTRISLPGLLQTVYSVDRRVR